MNDRYLYKAKRKHESKFFKKGEWVEGAYYIEPYTDKCFIIQWNSTGLGFNEFIEVDGESVCQCTGLKDKNGKLIWENDIFNSGNLVVRWREELASYCLTKKGWMYQHFFGEAVDACDCEVIGNIFDNPELLEVGE